MAGRTNRVGAPSASARRLHTHFDSLLATHALADALSILALLAITVVYYRSVTLSNSILLGFDIFTYFYPNEQYAVDSLLGGSLPLWNPYLFAGVPFAANTQTAVFYPPNLIFLLFSIPQAYAYSVVLHVFLAGLYTYMFCRISLKLGPFASLAGACTFAFSGFVGSMVGHLNQLHAAAWLPLLLLLAHQAWWKRSAWYGVLGGIVLAVQLLAGHAQESYLTLVMLLLFLTYEVFFGPSAPLPLWERVRVRVPAVLLPTSLIVTIGIGLAAVQLVPAAELSSLSIRAGGMPYQDAVSFSFPPWMILKGLFPAFSDPQPFSEFLGYVGVFGLVAFLVGLSTSFRRPYVSLLVGIAAMSIFFALGQFNPLYPVVYKLVPGLSLFRVPARWLFLYTFSISVLVGIGVAALGTRLDAGEIRRFAARMAISTLAFLLLMAAAFVLTRSSFPEEVPSRDTLAIWGFVAALAVALVAAGLRVGRWPVQGLAVGLILAELFAAGQFLDLNRANVPEAFSSMRPAVAHLLADRGIYRALALSENTFDPGDTAEIKSMLSNTLSPVEIYDYLVATKLKETLMPNIPLRYSIPTIDGYDGGMLPLKRYAEFKQLLVGKSAPDARLREKLKDFPSSRLLAGLNVKYILMDRIRDAWVEGVYYDLALSHTLSASGKPLVLSSSPSFESTAIGIVSHLVDGANFATGIPIALVTVTDARGKTYELPLHSGVETAEGRWTELSDSGQIEHSQAKKAKAWKGNPQAWDYLGMLSFPEAIIPRTISVRYLQTHGQLVIKGISQIDARTGMSEPVVLSDSYRLVHVGDVKIYENKDVLPRAYVVHEPLVVAGDAEALRALGDETFEPGRQVVLLENEWQGTSKVRQEIPGLDARLPVAGSEASAIDVYQPGEVVIKASLQRPGFVVLTDSHYPGWRAFVDGKESPIIRANYLFRAVELDAGAHVVEFRYEPFSWIVGAIISSLTVLALIVLLARRLHARRQHRYPVKSNENVTLFPSSPRDTMYRDKPIENNRTDG